MDKFDIAGDEIRSTQTVNRTVLDAGCRDCIFSTNVPEGWQYNGLDLFQNPAGSVTYVQTLEDPIPAAERAFGVVVALDVVEHVDKMSAVMDELWRVTDRKLIVALPNMAWALYRMSFLFSGRMGDKYKVLPYGSDDGDRHRWLTTADDSIRFMREFVAAKEEASGLRWFATAESRKRKLFSSMAKALGRGEQFYAPTMVFVIERA
jgi:hypothetical protein